LPRKPRKETSLQASLMTAMIDLAELTPASTKLSLNMTLVQELTSLQKALQ